MKKNEEEESEEKSVMGDYVPTVNPETLAKIQAKRKEYQIDKLFGE